MSWLFGWRSRHTGERRVDQDSQEEYFRITHSPAKGYDLFSAEGFCTRDYVNGQFRNISDEYLQWREVVLDMSATRDIDTTGVAEIISLAQTIRRQGRRLSICGVSGRVEHYFNMVKVDFLGFYPTVEQAERYMSTPAES